MLEVIRFTATWCGPCKMITPIFEKLKAEFTDVTFHTIDIDTEKEIANQNNIRSVPTIFFGKNGKILERLIGVHTESTYRDTIVRLKNTHE